MYLVTLFFQIEKDGWSETYANTASSDTQIVSAVKVLLTKRAAMLGAGASITYLRISDPAIKRDLVFPLNIQNQFPVMGQLGQTEQASAGVNMKYFTVNNKEWGTRIFRGVPTTAFTSASPNGLKPGDPFYGAHSSFFDTLKAQNNGWVLRTKIGTTFAWKNFLPIRATTKRCGRPFGLRRGRKFAHRVHLVLHSPLAEEPSISSAPVIPPSSGTLTGTLPGPQ